MGTAKLYAVFYRPRYGNYQHWALYLEKGIETEPKTETQTETETETETEHTVFEVSGQHPEFVRNETSTDPRIAGDFLSLMFLDTVGRDDVATVMRVGRQIVRIDNDTVEWDCQDYVLDMLECLEHECVVDMHDWDYRVARDELRDRRGAIW